MVELSESLVTVFFLLTFPFLFIVFMFLDSSTTFEGCEAEGRSRTFWVKWIYIEIALDKYILPKGQVNS